MTIYITGGGKTSNVSLYVTQVTWSGDYQSCARTLEISVLSSPSDKSLQAIRCNIMDGVTMTHDGKTLFVGYIIKRDRATNSNTIDLTCYDKGFYLKNIEVSYKFKNTTPEDITQRLANDYNIPIGRIVKTNYKMSRNFLGKNLYEIIQSAYTLASKQTKDKYQVVFRGKSLYVEPRGGNDTALILRGGVNLMDATVSESAENVKTRVKIYDKNDKFVRNVDNTDAIKLYGILQDYVKQSEDDNGSAEAKKILEDGTLEQKITVNSLGDARCVTGDRIYLQEPYTGLYGLFYIDSDVHTWKNGQYYNKLVLNLKNVMDEKEAGSLEKKTETKKKSTKKEEKKDEWEYIYEPDGSKR